MKTIRSYVVLDQKDDSKGDIYIEADNMKAMHWTTVTGSHKRMNEVAEAGEKALTKAYEQSLLTPGRPDLEQKAIMAAYRQSMELGLI